MKKYIILWICLSCTTLYGGTLRDDNKQIRVDTAVAADNHRTSENDVAKPEIPWNIFPNPIEDILHVTGLESTYTIKIIDSVGQLVMSVKGSSAEEELDMSSKPAGLYLIKIESQGKSITRKLIKK